MLDHLTKCQGCGRCEPSVVDGFCDDCAEEIGRDLVDEVEEFEIPYNGEAYE